MTTQTPDLETAYTLARDGMARALAHADQAMLDAIGVDPYDARVKWADIALAYLRRHAERHYLFTAEEVAEASKAWGMIQPPSDRAWGHIYRRAQRAGIIEMAGVGRSRRRHGSICPRWRSLVYQGVLTAAVARIA